MIETLAPKAPDPLLKIIKMFRDDPRTDKIDLGVGVYKDATGNTPVMKAVKDAEALLLASQRTKTYVGQQGDIDFLKLVGQLTFGGVVARICVDTNCRRHRSAAFGLRLVARNRREARAAAGAVLAQSSVNRARRPARS